MKVEYKGNKCKLWSVIGKLLAMVMLVSYTVNLEVSNDVVSKNISFLDFNDGLKLFRTGTKTFVIVLFDTRNLFTFKRI